MNKPWILAGILLTAHMAWAQSENVTSKEPSKTRQATEVLSGVAAAKVSPGAATVSNNILVRNIPYTFPAAEVQTSVASKTAVKPLAPAASNKPAPLPQQKEKTALFASLDSVCRLGGFEEDDMTPEECRKHGGVMITTAQTSFKPKKSAPKPILTLAPSKQTENPSLFDSQELVCRLRGYEIENMSSEECRKQGGMMISTGNVPTRHSPPLNGQYMGKKEKIEKKEAVTPKPAPQKVPPEKEKIPGTVLNK